MSFTASPVRAVIRGRYEVLDVVGRGGQGTVMRALDVVHQRKVALKVKALPRNEDRKAALEEARVLFAVRPHPNLALLREDFVLGDRYYLVMDWIEGQNLRQVLSAEGAPGLSPEQVLDYVGQAGEAVDHLHAHDPPVLHQDLKPANLIRTSEGRIVLVDFGICSPARDIRMVAQGTPDYAAPELFTEGPSPSSDVFSLAATAYALLTGAPPRPGPPPDVADPAIATMLQAIRRGLAIDPARRPSSAASLVESLRPAPPPAAPAASPVSEGGLLSAGSGNAAARTGLRAKMRRVALVAALPGLLALGLVAYGPLHAFRSAVHPARPSPPLLRPVDDGLVSCPLGYLCAWRSPQFRSGGVGIYGNEHNYAKFPEQLRFIAGQAASVYNHGIPAPQEGKPDVIIFTGTDFQGSSLCLPNGQSYPS
ncbi:MAG TPA: serine/threonine-protein kinase, partial [Actinomycetota bacterium]|nr:serine/threonine-protein kinase [Actinomycetota bacterium]